MKILVTGSAGHLGEALLRTLEEKGQRDLIGLDLVASQYTTNIGSITDTQVYHGPLYQIICIVTSISVQFVRECMTGVDIVYHTATLHKPHVATHTRQQFVDTNITGTLNLLEAAAVQPQQPVFIFTSTTSVYGDALEPNKSGDPAVWVTEETIPIPKNIYGVTKLAAEDLCQLFHRNQGLSCLILRTSRFFSGEDDDPISRSKYSDQNLKCNEYLHRRVDIEDCVEAHFCAAERAQSLGFGKFIITATTPFCNEKNELVAIRCDPTRILKQRAPTFEKAYEISGWKMSEDISRVYDNKKARIELQWSPKYDFSRMCDTLHASMVSGMGPNIKSSRALQIGKKYYHSGSTETVGEQPYPVDIKATKRPKLA